MPDRASKFAPRRYRQPQLLACLLVKEQLGLDDRTTEEVLSASDELRASLGLARCRTIRPCGGTPAIVSTPT